MTEAVTEQGLFSFFLFSLFCSVQQLLGLLLVWTLTAISHDLTQATDKCLCITNHLQHFHPYSAKKIHSN